MIPSESSSNVRDMPKGLSKPLILVSSALLACMPFSWVWGTAFAGLIGSFIGLRLVLGTESSSGAVALLSSRLPTRFRRLAPLPSQFSEYSQVFFVALHRSQPDFWPLHLSFQDRRYVSPKLLITAFGRPNAYLLGSAKVAREMLQSSTAHLKELSSIRTFNEIGVAAFLVVA